MRRKLVIVGDGACGKTSFLSRFTLGYFVSRHVPSVFEHYVVDCWVDGISVQLALWDTAEQGDYKGLRALAYARAHVVVIGFGVDKPESLENVQHTWIAEVIKQCPGIPIILVGLKKDLREDELATGEKSGNFVSQRDGAEMAGLCGARKYLECSSLTGEGVDDVFEAATRAALTLEEGQAGGGCCVIL